MMQKYYYGGGENAQETEEERRFTRILIQSATFASQSLKESHGVLCFSKSLVGN